MSRGVSDTKNDPTLKAMATVKKIFLRVHVMFATVYGHNELIQVDISIKI